MQLCNSTICMSILVARKTVITPLTDQAGPIIPSRVAEFSGTSWNWKNRDGEGHGSRTGHLLPLGTVLIRLVYQSMAKIDRSACQDCGVADEFNRIVGSFCCSANPRYSGC